MRVRFTELDCWDTNLAKIYDAAGIGDYNEECREYRCTLVKHWYKSNFEIDVEITDTNAYLEGTEESFVFLLHEVRLA